MKMSRQGPWAPRASLRKGRGYTGELVTETQLTLGSQGWPAKCQFAYVGDGPDNDTPEPAKPEPGSGTAGSTQSSLGATVIWPLR